jgi:hypothetical protein
MRVQLSKYWRVIKRLFLIRVRKIWKRITHPVVFGTPVLSEIVETVNSLRYLRRFSQANYDNFYAAPLSRRKAWWSGLREEDCLRELGGLPSSADILSSCRNTHDALGVWPISFSYPRIGQSAPSESAWEQRALKSHIVPGSPHGYGEEEPYLANYRGSKNALTHKKAGWDCFRHLEILASGAIPVMPDARHIPRETMVHYPKAVLEEVSDALPRLLGNVSENSRQELRQFFEENMTSRAMAQYIRTSAGIRQGEKVLFVDQSLTTKADYLSVLSLIGLTQESGADITPLFDPACLYAGFPGDTHHLWGRGFGYSRVLPEGLRKPLIDNPEDYLEQNLHEFDWVLVGSVTRNWRLAEELLSRFDPERTIWLHGEDKPPARDERNYLAARVGNVFVRELDARR